MRQRVIHGREPLVVEGMIRGVGGHRGGCAICVLKV